MAIDYDVIDRIKKAGLVGLGGGGFPTYAKWQDGAEIIIANGAECEPLLIKDQFIMENYPSEIINGLKLAMTSTGAKKGIVTLKEKYKKSILSIERQIKDSNIAIIKLPDFYPAGDEFILVEHVTGRRVPVGGFPTQIGVIVNNVETIYFASLAERGEAFTHKFISVIGQVKKQGVYEVPIGTRFEDILNNAVLLNKPYRLFKDGLMMGKNAGLTDVVEKTTSAIFALPIEVGNIVNSSIPIDIIKRRARSACEKCMFCTDLCPRYLSGYPIEPHRIIRGFSLSVDENVDEKIIAMAYNCSECGICEIYACPMWLSPRQVNRYIKMAFKKPDVSLGINNKSDYFNERKLPISRLINRLSINEFKTDVKFISEIEPDRVELPLRGYAGAILKPLVKNADSVRMGQVIASNDYTSGKIYNNVCSPFHGKILSVKDRIVIERI